MSYADSTNGINDGGWHHCALIWDRSEANQIKIWIDGQDETLTNGSWGISAGASDVTPAGAFEIGRRGAGSNYIDGHIVDVRYGTGGILAQEAVDVLSGCVMPDNGKYINAGTLRLHIPIVGIGRGNASSVDLSDISATSNN